MRALVTGATGFIGRALALKLIEQGWDVDLLLRNSIKPLSENFHGCRTFFYDFDQENSTNLRAAVNNCDVVFHAAAIRNRWGTVSQDFYTVNVLGTNHLFQACLGRVNRFVYISSVGVFGYPGVLNIDESYPVIKNTSSWDYHTSKVAAEQVLSDNSHKIEVVIIRPTISYGAGDETGMVTRLIGLISSHRFIRIGDGSNYIHLIHIDDLTHGLVQAGIDPAAAGQIFILSGPQPVQINQLLIQLESLLQIKLPKLFIPMRIAYLIGTFFERIYQFAAKMAIFDLDHPPPITKQMVLTFCANRSFNAQKATEIIHFKPRIDLEEGLTDTIKWMKSANRLK